MRKYYIANFFQRKNSTSLCTFGDISKYMYTYLKKCGSSFLAISAHLICKNFENIVSQKLFSWEIFLILKTKKKTSLTSTYTRCPNSPPAPECFSFLKVNNIWENGK